MCYKTFGKYFQVCDMTEKKKPFNIYFDPHFDKAFSKALLDTIEKHEA